MSVVVVSAAPSTSSPPMSTSLPSTYIAQVPADEPRPLAVEAALEVPLIDPITGEDLGIPLVGIVDLVLDGQEKDSWSFCFDWLGFEALR